jgi:hypothetical protein
MKLKGRRFETVSHIRKEFQAVRKMASTVLWSVGKNGGIAVYLLKETILKEIAAKIE